MPPMSPRQDTARAVWRAVQTDPPSLPVAAQVARYQKHRLKKLRRQGGA